MSADPFPPEDEFISGGGDAPQLQFVDHPRPSRSIPTRAEIAAAGIACVSNLWRPVEIVKLRSDDPGVIALGKLVAGIPRGKMSAIKQIDLESIRTFQLDVNSQAALAFAIEKSIRRVSAFLYLFIHLPGNMEDEGSSMQGLARAHLSGALPTTDWESWLSNSLALDLRSLSVLRDWISCFGQPSQSSTFEFRAWDPVQAFHTEISQRLRTREPWPKANSWYERLIQAADYFAMLGRAISAPKGRGTLDREPSGSPPDQWNFPPRLRRIAYALRTAGRMVTTAELRVMLREDPNQIVAKSKGCSPEDRKWANKHLKNQRGRWQWKPPEIASFKK